MPSDYALQIKVKDEGATKVSRALDVLTSPPAFQTFLRTQTPQYFQARTSARFGAEGDEASGKWQPLAPATVEIRESMGYPGSHPINVRDGLLKSQLLRSRGSVVQTGEGAEMTWPALSEFGGDTLNKFLVAQQGSSFRSGPDGRFGPTPARPVVAADQTDAFAIAEMLTLQLKSLLEGVAL